MWFLSVLYKIIIIALIRLVLSYKVIWKIVLIITSDFAWIKDEFIFLFVNTSMFDIFKFYITYVNIVIHERVYVWCMMKWNKKYLRLIWSIPFALDTIFSKANDVIKIIKVIVMALWNSSTLNWYISGAVLLIFSSLYSHINTVLLLVCITITSYIFDH